MHPKHRGGHRAGPAAQGNSQESKGENKTAKNLQLISSGGEALS